VEDVADLRKLLVMKMKINGFFLGASVCLFVNFIYHFQHSYYVHSYGSYAFRSFLMLGVIILTGFAFMGDKK